MKRRFWIFLLFSMSGMSGFLLSWYIHQDARKTEIIQTNHYPVSFVNQLKGDPHAGEKIFKEFCISCHGHDPIINVNAPRIGDKSFWQTGKKRKKSEWLAITINGKGAMPARGGCFECSDEQLWQAIQFLIKSTYAVPS